jgi:hypothetical protein
MEKIFITKCLRCCGAVVYDKFYGPHGQFWGWKCLICGDIVDPLILANRRLVKTGQEIKV